MDAFVGAVKAGAHAIETDIHLSKDGVVVLSHVGQETVGLGVEVLIPITQDATLKRCFGTEKKIIECDWDFLSQQQTLKEPHASMPRLTDLLEYLAHPGLEHVWLLLDIKVFFSDATLLGMN